jgi:hypothetical protein
VENRVCEIAPTGNATWSCPWSRIFVVEQLGYTPALGQSGRAGGE